MAQISARIPDAVMGELRKTGNVTKAVNDALAEYLARRHVSTERRITKHETRPDGWRPMSGDRVLVSGQSPKGWHGCIVRVVRCYDDAAICRMARPNGGWSKAYEVELTECYPTKEPLTILPAKKHESRMIGKRVEISDGGLMYRVPGTIIGDAGRGKYRVRTRAGKEKIAPRSWLEIIG